MASMTNLASMRNKKTIIKYFVSSGALLKFLTASDKAGYDDDSVTVFSTQILLDLQIRWTF